jgi:hypothetical protein
MATAPGSPYAITLAELERGVEVPVDLQVQSVSAAAGHGSISPDGWAALRWMAGGLAAGGLGWAVAADDGD